MRYMLAKSEVKAESVLRKTGDIWRHASPLTYSRTYRRALGVRRADDLYADG
jgi:hypothetical protein